LPRGMTRDTGLRCATPLAFSVKFFARSLRSQKG